MSIDLEYLKCSVTAIEKQEFLFLDISINGFDYVNKVLTIQVFDPVNIVQVDPLYLDSRGGTTINFITNSLKTSEVMYCLFAYNGYKLRSKVVVSNNISASCISPQLPLNFRTYFYIMQHNSSIYGPEDIIVSDVAVVEYFQPKLFFSGISNTITFVSSLPILNLPGRVCVFQGVQYSYINLNSTHGLCIISPTNIGNHDLFIKYDDVQSLELYVGLINVVRYPDDISISVDAIPAYGNSNVTIHSSSCGFSYEIFCKIDGQLVSTIPIDNCDIVCNIVMLDHSKATKLDVCTSQFCYSPVFSTVLKVLSMINVVATFPKSGPVLGGPIIKLLGSGFYQESSLKCAFGINKVSAIFISSTEILCRLPSANPGIVNVNVEVKEQVISNSITSFEYIPLVSTINFLSSFKLSSIGGTDLTFTVPMLSNIGPYSCRFGYKQVPAVFINESTLRCKSPILENSNVVAFAVSVDNSDISVTKHLEVISSPNPIFIDPTIIDYDTATQISVMFDREVEEHNLECSINNQFLTASVSGSIMICYLNSGLRLSQYNLTIHDNSVVISTFPIQVRLPVKIMQIYPLQGLGTLSSTITLRLYETLQHYDYVQCCFGGIHKTLASIRSSNEIQCSTPKVSTENVTYLHIGLSVGTGFCAYSGFEYKFLSNPQVKSISDATGPYVGGTSIVLTFSKDLNTDSLYCKFGSVITIGQVLNSNQLLCITKLAPLGLADIEISLNQVDFVSTGFQFAFQSIQISALDNTSSTPVTISNNQVILFYITPQTVATESQSLVTVYGSGFQKGCSCYLNGSYQLITKYLSFSEVQCTMPIHSPGTDNLSVLNLDGSKSTGASIEFVIDPSLLLIPPFPASGPKNVPVVITVFGNNLDSFNSSLYCLIGTDWGFAFNVTKTSVQCIVPTSYVLGKVKVSLSIQKEALISGYTYYEYINDPIILSSSPLSGSSGTDIIVKGYGFDSGDDYQCLIGGIYVITTVLNNGMLLCRVPVMDIGVHPISIKVNDQHYVNSGYTFQYIKQIILSKLWPSNGPSLRGGTLLSIYGSDFTSNIDTYCVFDSFHVPASIVSSQLIQCVTPPHKPGLVNISVLLDGSHIHSDQTNLQFLYVPDVSVDKITPEFGYTSGQYPVLVFGSNFLNSTALGCRFSDMLSRGVFLTNNSIVCLAPSPLGRSELSDYSKVTVEITVNGYDYTDSGVTFKYSEPCDQGFFCPGMSRQLCPNGTYCPPNSQNFTICEPGTFQPKEGQTACVICSIGYICPDNGMQRPVVCPPGFICDVMGLRSSIKLCPKGNYCLNGTKADSLTLFKSTAKSSWVEDYVTGVSTFNVSSYNWKYHTWPAPAVGQSVSLHQPEESCDGLVCSGGSKSILAEAPFPCPIGHYCRAGAGTQIPMPKNFSTPQRCFDGFFCSRGSYTPEGEGPCPNGYFCPTQLDAIECPEGYIFALSKPYS